MIGEPIVKGKRSRYPGINFFTKDDADIFCGRKTDADKLFTRIMNNSTMILHGDSGTGKSSLVQAGILPLLDSRNELLKAGNRLEYLPITIRFDALQEKYSVREQAYRRGIPGRQTVNMVSDPAYLPPFVEPAGDKGNHTNDDPELHDVLARQTFNIIKKQLGEGLQPLPYIKPADNNFWYVAKQLEREHFAFFLIFDQFEELQGYSYREKELFAQKLSELFVSTVPASFYKEYNKRTSELLDEQDLNPKDREEISRNIKFLEQPLNTRILFVIREDRLGVMSSLSNYFPDILKNNFFLQPLLKESATQAITEPAEREGDFVSPCFTFDEDAKQALLKNLVDESSGLYDPFQLQIVCRSIERNVKQGINVKAVDIPNVPDILSRYYSEMWDDIRKEVRADDFDDLHEQIIKDLVVDNRRNLVLENKLVVADNANARTMVNMMMRKGLLKSITSGNDIYYQLTHDRLMDPVNRDLEDIQWKRMVQEQVQSEKEDLYRLRAKISTGMVISFYGLRQLIGIILFALPVLVCLGKLISTRSFIPEESISAYYYVSLSSDILVGLQFVLGFLFLIYKGYDQANRAASLIGFTASLGAALSNLDYAKTKAMDLLHYFFFLILFSVLIYFTREFEKSGDKITSAKKKRNMVYKICNLIMWPAVLLTLAVNFFPSNLHLLFWLESIIFMTAGISWLVKGGVFLRDDDEIYSRRGGKLTV